MTQDERWKAKYDEIMAFMAENHRRPSKYYVEERNNWNWMRHQQKQMGLKRRQAATAKITKNSYSYVKKLLLRMKYDSE